MPFFPRIKGTLRALTRGERLDSELDEELRSYLDLLIDEKTAAGMDPVQARREALIELGGVEQVKANVREERHGAHLDMLLQDIRFSLRMLRKSPGFAIVVRIAHIRTSGILAFFMNDVRFVICSQVPGQKEINATRGFIDHGAGVPTGILSIIPNDLFLAPGLSIIIGSFH